ncbi:MAG: GHKL domain-containing protein [Desulfobacteraceae bacterium]|nr:GHKL domain-containing protein [Desulfobacteraceae bacterium]
MFQKLSPVQQNHFFAILDRALQSRKDFTSKEERKAKRKLIADLENREIKEAESIADTLVDMGIYDDILPFLPIFEQENNAHILQAAYNLAAQHHNSNIILNAVERASKIVFALKSYARYDTSGNMIIADITEGIDVVLTLYHNWLKKGVEVVKQYDDIPAIQCYADELNQVWTNLIHNAIQAMDSKGTLEIAVFQENQNIVACFTDSGYGISKEIKDRIFDPFFTSRPPGEGSGLGLDIVRKIIDRHKGGIEVESQPGKTSFRVLLPVRKFNEE